MNKEQLFTVTTPIGVIIRTSHKYWEVISTIKHPSMRDRLEDVKQTLESPDEVRKSRIDHSVILFYRQVKRKRWICAVIKSLNGKGFLVTAFLTDAIKEGELLWTK
ncbi:DUF4258 domain-containing protein [bacterium]|nr:DUF4258 domain-containing protein [bacterium]